MPHISGIQAYPSRHDCHQYKKRFTAMKLSTSILLLLTSNTLGALALAQTPPAPVEAQPIPSAPRDNVEDLTASTLTSPPQTPSSAPAAAPTPAPAPPASYPQSQPARAPTVLAPAAIAPAEEPAVPPGPAIRHGFYLRAFSGIGYAGFSGRGPNGHVSIQGLGAQSLFAIGGSVGRGVVLAGTLQASGTTAEFKGGPFEHQTVTLGESSVNASAKADVSSSQIGLLLDWYPAPTIGWHVGASGGLGAISLLNRADDSTLVGASLSGTLFGGYDWFIAKEWSMGIALLASGVTSANMKESKEGTDAGYRLRAVSVGLAGSILYF